MTAFPVWPANRRSAISLSFDDALTSHLEHAAPILDRYGLRGTFYVNPGPESMFEKQIDRWRKVHEAGHELGNHTISHPCSGKHPFTPADRALERWTLEMICTDIDQASRRLIDLVPDLGPVSFAYPCGESFVGEGPTYTSYEPEVARRFVAARGVAGVINDPLTCNLSNLGSWIVQDVGAEQLIARVRETVEAGGWGIFCFHGVGGEHLPVSVEALEGLVRFLREHEDEIWVETVVTIGKYLSTLRAAGETPDAS